MVHQAKLLYEDVFYPIISYNFSFNQRTDWDNQPNEKTIFKRLHVVLPSPKSNVFWEWAVLVKKASRPLEIHLNSVLGMERTLVIKLYDAYCLEHLTKFDSESTDPVTDTMEISCGGMKHYSSDTEFSAWFRKTYPNADIPLTVIEEDNEKQFSRYYLTDKNGKPIEDYKAGDFIILNLETQNRIGDTVTIDLNDNEYDFKHYGVVLENDILRNISITNDLVKIELEVIAQKNN